MKWAVHTAHQFSQNRIPGADAIEQKIQEPVLLGWGDERGIDSLLVRICCWGNRKPSLSQLDLLDIPTPVPTPASMCGGSRVAAMVRTAPTATIANGSENPRKRQIIPLQWLLQLVNTWKRCWPTSLLHRVLPRWNQLRRCRRNRDLAPSLRYYTYQIQWFYPVILYISKTRHKNQIKKTTFDWFM